MSSPDGPTSGPFDSPLAIFLAQQYPELKIIPEGPEYCIENADIPFPIGMGFNKNDPAFTAFLQAVVDCDAGRDRRRDHRIQRPEVHGAGNVGGRG